MKSAKRGYIRPSPKHPRQTQWDSLIEYGADPETIYVEGENSETIEAAIKPLRPGDEFPVMTLARLAPNRQLLRKYISEIQAKGAIIVETKTGRRLDNAKDAAAAVLDAVDELAQDKRTHSPEAAKRYGKLGGRPLKTDRLSDADAETIWFDRRIETNPEALDLMIGWSTSEAYRKFGSSGRPAGRRRKPKTD